MKDICRDLMVTPLEKRKQNLQNELARIVLVINMERAEYWQAEQNFEPDRGYRYDMRCPFAVLKRLL